MLPAAPRRSDLWRASLSPAADAIDAFGQTPNFRRDVDRKVSALFSYVLECQVYFAVKFIRRGPGHLVNQAVEAIGLLDKLSASQFVPDRVDHGRELVAAR